MSYVVFGVVAFGSLIITATMTLRESWPEVTLLSLFMAVAALPAFNQPILSNLYSSSFFKAGIREGWLPEPENHRYYGELARYMEAYGVRGHLPGDLAWGLAYWAIFLATIPGSVILTLISFPLLGEAAWAGFAAIEVPTAFSFFILYGRKTTRMMKEATDRGFPLWNLRPRSRAKASRP